MNTPWLQIRVARQDAKDEIQARVSEVLLFDRSALAQTRAAVFIRALHVHVHCTRYYEWPVLVRNSRGSCQRGGGGEGSLEWFSALVVESILMPVMMTIVRTWAQD